jgi:hypothetical protein
MPLKLFFVPSYGSEVVCIILITMKKISIFAMKRTKHWAKPGVIANGRTHLAGHSHEAFAGGAGVVAKDKDPLLEGLQEQWACIPVGLR